MTNNQSRSLLFGATALIDGPISFSRKRTPSKTAATSNSDFRSGIQISADKFHPSDEDQLSTVIAAAYRQVFGNVQPMESERLASAESRLRNGEIDVREFVRELAKSAFYRSRYFDTVGPHRSVELSFKHILGRPPHNEAEVSEHIARVAVDGFNSGIDSLVDSEEYNEVFGADTVPYARAWSSNPGQPQSAFNRIAALEQNFAGSDTAIGSRSQLMYSLAKASTQTIKIPGQVFRSGFSVSGGYAGGPTGSTSFKPVTRASSDGGDSTPLRGDLYVGFGLGQREQEKFERCPGDSNDQINALIRATYRQVMGNPHLMESERVTTAESKFTEGYLSTREFVRAIALSAEYQRRFFETNAPYRFVELNFKHLLGRPPQSQAELSQHIVRLATQGYEAEINSYLDCEEYQSTFGENTVPFARITTEAGRNQIGFNRHLALVQGFAASDTVQNSSILVNSVATNAVPSGWGTTTIRTNRNGAFSGGADATTKRFRIVVKAQPAGGRQRTPNASYLVSGKDITSQLSYIHRRGGKIESITEVI
jgi:phycoerythrin-associated linker protein